jgi:hypothetical protein
MHGPYFSLFFFKWVGAVLSTSGPGRVSTATKILYEFTQKNKNKFFLNSMPTLQR